MTKIAGSGSISQRHGSADPDPDPPQNVMDPQHCVEVWRKFDWDTDLVCYAKIFLQIYTAIP